MEIVPTGPPNLGGSQHRVSSPLRRWALILPWKEETMVPGKQKQCPTWLAPRGGCVLLQSPTWVPVPLRADLGRVVTITNPPRQWKDVCMCTYMYIHVHTYTHSARVQMFTCASQSHASKAPSGLLQPQEVLRNTESEPHPRPTETSTLGTGLDKLYVISPAGEG